MDHEEGWLRGLVLYGLHPHNRSQNVPGRGRPGPTTQIGPLHGPGLSVGGSSKGAYGLPT